jgi:fibronectin-binding autotransporter adhesin
MYLFSHPKSRGLIISSFNCFCGIILFASPVKSATVTWSGASVFFESTDTVEAFGTTTLSPGGYISISDELTLSGASPTVTLMTDGVDGAVEFLLDGNLTISAGLTGTATINTSGSGPTPAVNLGGGIRIFSVADGSAATDLLISADIQNGGFTKTGAGTLELTGVNDLADTVTISAGTLLLNRATADSSALKTDGDTSSTSDIVINGGSLLLAKNEQIGNSGSIVLSSGSLSTVGSGKTETIDRLSISGGSFTSGQNAMILSSGLSLSGGTTLVSTGALVSSKNITIAGGNNTVANGGSLRVAAGTGLVGLYFDGTNPTLKLNASNSTPGTLLLRQNLTTSSSLVGTGEIQSVGSGSNAGRLDLGNAVRDFDIGDAMAPVDFSVSAVLTNGGINKKGAGTLSISGPNNYVGGTTITAGTLLLGASNTLPNVGNVTLATGATLATGGNDDSAGPLSLGGNAVIDFGAGSGSELTFSNVGTWTGILQIWNYNGSPWTLGVDKLIFSANTPGADLSTPQFYSDAGITPIGVGAVFIGNELVPVPESSTSAAALLLAGLVGFRGRRQLLHFRTR